MSRDHPAEERLRRWRSLPRHRVTLLAIGIRVAVAVGCWRVVTTPEPVVPTSFAQAPASSLGFDLRTSTVNIQDIRAGGPPKDGIPALTRPSFITAAQADFLRPGDRVIGVAIAGEARAYPLAILNYHEIVNDTIGQTPLVVTYCPLCDSAAVFDRRTPLGEREFGVSGLLYQSNVLMYDRRGQPESLWSQVLSAGISGPAASNRLTALPCELTTWESWNMRYPKSLVLSPRTGYPRDYRRNPYAKYFTHQQLMFPVAPIDRRLPNKERVLGVWTGDCFRAYPESRMPKDRRQIRDTLEGKTLTLEWDPQSRTLRVVTADEGVEWLYSFWFAWYAMHPETSLYAPATGMENLR
jgi:hypothetical protein